MQNLNLYNYYDKSLADINKEYLTTVASSRKDTGKKGISGKILAISFFFLILIGAGGIYGYYKLNSMEVAKLRYLKPSGPDMRTSEEKLGYVKVQIFEFADEQAEQAKKDEVKKEAEKQPYESALAAKIREFSKSEAVRNQERPTAYDETKKIIDSVNKEGAKKPASPVKEQQKKPAEKKTAKAAVPVQKIKPNKEKSYSVIFEDINRQQYDFVKKAGALFKMKGELLDSDTHNKSVWRLYRMDGGGNVEIGGKKASFIKDFADKEKAVIFAKENKIQAIIRAENTIDGTYSIKFCCSDLENAKKLAENSNITNKTIKIVREE